MQLWVTGTEALRAVGAAEEAQPLPSPPRGQLGKARAHVPRGVGTQPSATPGGGREMEREEVGEREEKEKNEFSCCPSGVAIDRVQAGVERC